MSVSEMLDERHDPRFDALRGGTVETPVSAITCVVRNISKNGACLEASDPKTIPDNFLLTIWPSLNYTCEVIWRRKHRLGLRFKEEKSAEIVTTLATTSVPARANPNDRVSRKDTSCIPSSAIGREVRSARVVMITPKAIPHTATHEGLDAQAKQQQGSCLLSRPSKVGGLSRPAALSFARKDD
jgi:hypothetical protein